MSVIEMALLGYAVGWLLSFGGLTWLASRENPFLWRLMPAGTRLAVYGVMAVRALAWPAFLVLVTGALAGDAVLLPVRLWKMWKNRNEERGDDEQ